MDDGSGLTMLAALSEDQTSVPSAHIALACNSSCKAFGILVWPLSAYTCNWHGYMHTHAQTWHYTHTGVMHIHMHAYEYTCIHPPTCTYTNLMKKLRLLVIFLQVLIAIVHLGIGGRNQPRKWELCRLKTPQ